MDNQRTTAALLDRTNNNVVQLLKRFENIVALAPVTTPASRHATAVEAYQMEVETAALVRAAEDLLSMTRSMKEAWVFGRLLTVEEREGKRDGEGEGVERDARVVGEGVGELLRRIGGDVRDGRSGES